ncbi:MAG: ATP-binding cassette domain-containing protein [Eubacteriales bacterium]
MSELLSTSKLSKKYGSRFALKDADIHIKQGDIYGLIGRNGAGKTTLLKMINSQIVKTSGEIYTRGEAMKFGWPGIKIGALVEAPGLYPDCTAHDNLMYKCLAMGIYSKAYVDGLLRRVELQNTGKKKVKQFSLGMKQRLSIALALVNEPDLLILDEPINGMDPQGIRDIREMLVSVNREMGVTILISSHILDELAKFATTYGIIKDGLVLREFTREELEHENRSGIEVESPQIEAVESILREEMHLVDMQRTAEGNLMIRDGVERYGDISRLLFDRGIYVAQFSVRRESLENYFMRMTGGGRI